MKKITAFLAAIAMACSVSGCWQGNEENKALESELKYAFVSEKAAYKTTSMDPIGTVSNGILLGSSDGRSSRIVHWNCETDTFTDIELHNAGKKHGAATSVSLSGGRFGLIYQKGHFNTKKWDVDATAYMDIYNAELQYTETVYLPDLGMSYVSGIDSAVLDGKDYLLFACYGDTTNQLVVYDLEKEEISGTIDADFSIPVSGSDGEAYTCTVVGENEEVHISHVNIAENKLEPVTLNSEISGMYFFIKGSEEYAMYIYGDEAMYGIKINGDQAEAELVMDFSSSDFVNVLVLLIKAAPDGRFMVHERSSRSEALWVSRPRTEEEIRNCRVITMAGVDINEELKNTVVLYNTSHKEYHIMMTDYLGSNEASGYWSSDAFMDYSDEADEAHLAAVEKFRQDLLDGNVPDIIYVDNLPYVQFANKGLFLDMTELMEKDKRFREEDYMMSFFDSMKYKGQQQTIAFSFYVNTITGEKADVGEQQGITADAFAELLNTTPESYTEMANYYGGCFTREEYRDSFLGWMQSSFLDTENASCSFDSLAFAKLLEIGSTLPKTEDWPKYAQSKDGSLLELYGFNQPFDYHVLQYGAADKTLVGFPTTDGGNGGIFSAPYRLAINAKSKNTDEIWDIFMGLMSEEVQRKLDSKQETYSFPVLRSAYNEDMEAATKGERFIFGKSYGASTQEEIDFLDNYIQNINVFRYTDPTITKIIVEETDKLYAGDQTAEEAAKAIQSRASIYISEQY